MKITMNDSRLVSIAQLQAFLKGVDGAVTFCPETKGNKNKQAMYDWLENVLIKFRYYRVSKKDRGIILSYISEVTTLSRSQVKCLAKRKRKIGKLTVRTGERYRFPVRYDPSDIARLVETDNAHGRISGEATKRILEREYQIFGKAGYEMIRHISVSHLYNLRNKSRQYQSNVLFIGKTQAVNRNIGIRMKPQNEGKPGYLRVDSVHQGDLVKEKGVYHINLVDEVTQWEIIGCVEGISEQFLLPLLEELLDRFPFVILGFHSDNGSEYINYVVAKLLKKLMIDQTKSRSRRTNDNALVEGKNGSRVRKFMGYSYISSEYAKSINIFYRNYMDEYLNFHRPCGFATIKIDARGKEKKVYNVYKTPYEAFKSHPRASEFLKKGITFEMLNKIAYHQSDNECGKKLQENRLKLFKNFTI